MRKHNSESELLSSSTEFSSHSFPLSGFLKKRLVHMLSACPVGSVAEAGALLDRYSSSPQLPFSSEPVILSSPGPFLVLVDGWEGFYSSSIGRLLRRWEDFYFSSMGTLLLFLLPLFVHWSLISDSSISREHWT